MKILFVDDDHERRIRFSQLNADHEVFTAETSQNAINLIEDNEAFDEIHLDHDLSSVHDENNKGYDGNYPMLILTVRPLVEWLCKHKLTIMPHRVIVHSWNTASAHNMVKDLKEAGYNTEYKRFEF